LQKTSNQANISLSIKILIDNFFYGWTLISAEEIIKVKYCKEAARKDDLTKMAAQKENQLPYYIAGIVTLLMALGTVFVFSASSSITQEINLKNFYSFQAVRQILFFPLAVLIMHAVCRVDYHRISLTKGRLKSPITYLLPVSIALLIIVLIPRLGTEINQARRWIRIPVGPISISFQPSELAKWSIVFFLAAFFERYSNEPDSYWKKFIPICLIIALVIVLIIPEDFGTAAFIALVCFLMLLMAGIKLSHILTLIPAGAVVFMAVLLRSPSRLNRIAAFLHPEEWSSSAAYQANQSLIALGSGGLWGKGLGRGTCKYGHLPEDTSDFIFAIIGEELGLFGTTIIIALFIAFIWLGILVIVRCRDRLGQLVAGGIILSIGIQSALNIGVVTVVLPTKGIALPFVSAGGSGLLLSAAAVGVLINIAKQSPKIQVEGT